MEITWGDIWPRRSGVTDWFCSVFVWNETFMDQTEGEGRRMREGNGECGDPVGNAVSADEVGREGRFWNRRKANRTGDDSDKQGQRYEDALAHMRASGARALEALEKAIANVAA